MQRYINKMGYFRFGGVILEAACRLPTAKPPPDVHAPTVWADEMPADLKGRTFAITGSSQGMGYELGERVAERGGNLVLLNRPSAHADKVLAELQKLASKSGGDVIHIPCDLCDFGSVRAAADKLRSDLRARGWVLDALVLNAGLMAQGDTRTKDGYDIQMQANHLSHFLLTSLVFDLLEQAATKHGEARVVSHSSGARKGPPDLPLRPDAFATAWEAEADGKPSPLAGDAWPGMGKWKRYQQSKKANLAYTYSLAERIDARPGCKVKAVCAHPGATNSGLQSRTKGSTYLDNFINGLAGVVGHSTADGVLALAMAALNKDVSNGDFFGPEEVTGKAVRLPSEKAKDYPPEQLTLLWDKSVEATGAAWSV